MPTDNFQYQNQFIDTDNITLWVQRKNVQITDKNSYNVRLPLKLKKVACLIQDVVSPHCGDKRMVRGCTRSSLPNYFAMMLYHAGENTSM
jgi:hypothetical protein